MEKGISPSLNAFIAELEEYDKLIANDAEDLKPQHVRKKKRLELTAAKQRKAALIQNFVFENDGKTILEALLFIQLKVDSQAKEGMNRESAYWIQLWSKKAAQLYEKAEVLLPGEARIEAAYRSITETNKYAKSIVKRKVIASGLIVLVVAAGVILYGVGKKSPVKLENEESTVGMETSGGSENEESTVGIGTSGGTENVESTVGTEPSRGSKSAESTAWVEPAETDRLEDEQLARNSDNETWQSKEVQREAYELPVTRKLIKEAEKETEEKSGSETVILENFAFSIPDYWVERGSKEEYYQAYAETGGKVVMLSISYPVDDEDEVNIEALYEDNDNMKAAVESWLDACKVTREQKFRSDYGVDGMLYTYTFTYKQEGSMEYPGRGECLCFPSEEDNRWFFVNLSMVGDIMGDYDSDYREILASIRDKEN